jgi:hypothetical protein
VQPCDEDDKDDDDDDDDDDKGFSAFPFNGAPVE